MKWRNRLFAITLCFTRNIHAQRTPTQSHRKSLGVLFTFDHNIYLPTCKANMLSWRTMYAMAMHVCVVWVTRTERTSPANCLSRRAVSRLELVHGASYPLHCPRKCTRTVVNLPPRADDLHPPTPPPDIHPISPHETHSSTFFAASYTFRTFYFLM